MEIIMIRIEHIDTKKWGIGNYPCNMIKGTSEDMMVGYSGGTLRTQDGGDTWTLINGKRHRPNFIKLADGTYIAFGFTVL